MNKEQIIQKVSYLVKKYLEGRTDLLDLISRDVDSVKYIFTEIERGKRKEYDELDAELIKDIAFYCI